MDVDGSGQLVARRACIGEATGHGGVEPEDTSQGGLLLFYDDRLFLGMGHDGVRMSTWRGGKLSFWREPAAVRRVLFLRIVNQRNIVTFYYREDGQAWIRHGLRSETSGYNANTVDELASLRPALFATGSGRVRFHDFVYRALPEV